MKPINVKLLERLCACQPQVDTFYSIYGDSDAPMTVEEAVKQASVFDFNWLAGEVFKGKDLEEYERIQGYAWEEYKRIQGPAWEEYKRIQGPACGEYERIEVSAWEEYKRIQGPACEEYERIQGSAWEEYKRIQAKTFAVIYLKGYSNEQ